MHGRIQLALHRTRAEAKPQTDHARFVVVARDERFNQQKGAVKLVRV